MPNLLIFTSCGCRQLVGKAEHMANMKTFKEYWREETWAEMKAIRK